MLIKRIIETHITDHVTRSNKAIILYGPRQAGKTTLCKTIITAVNLKTLFINADEGRYIDALSSRDSRKLRELVHGYELVVIDEAQRVPDIGINLKIFIDTLPTLKIIATGSSSFELANTVSEPLTGRKITYQLYPIAQCELKEHYNAFELQNMLEERLIWGSYPEMFQLVGYEQKYAYMQEMSTDYLYKDIFLLQDIRKSEKIKNLLKLLAFQIGNEVSLNELSSKLDVSKETVGRYIDLLEKTFVLFSLSGFSRNLRKEVTKMNKYYFYDLGVRNALIDNFKPLAERNDIGALWENFLIVERIKMNHYMRSHKASYFWRIYTGAEVDYVEEGENALAGYEFKWNAKTTKPPASWQTTYTKASWGVVNRENWLGFASSLNN